MPEFSISTHCRRIDVFGNARTWNAAKISPRFKVTSNARIGTIEVEQARVTYRDPTSGLILEVQNLRGAARLIRRGVDATLHLDTFILQASGLRELVTDVDAAGWVHNDSLSLRKLTGRWLDRPVQLTGEVRRPLDTPELALRVRGEFDLAKLSQRFKSPAPFAGVATVDGTLQGRPDALEASGRVTTATLRAGPVQARDVAVRGRWSRGALDLSEVTAHLFNGTLRGSIATRPDHLEATRIAFRLERASLVALDVLAPTPIGLGGDLDFEGEFAGDPRRPAEADGRFRLASRRLTLPGDFRRIGPGTLSVRGVLRNGVAEIADAAGRWAGIEVEASGRLSREGPAGLRFRLGADLGTLAPLWDIRRAVGQASLAGEMNGRWDDPEIAARVRAPKITLADVAVEAIEASLRFRGKTLRMDSVAAALGQSRAIASGSLTWDGPGDLAKAGGERACSGSGPTSVPRCCAGRISTAGCRRPGRGRAGSAFPAAWKGHRPPGAAPARSRPPASRRDPGSRSETSRAPSA